VGGLRAALKERHVHHDQRVAEGGEADGADFERADPVGEAAGEGISATATSVTPAVIQ